MCGNMISVEIEIGKFFEEGQDSINNTLIKKRSLLIVLGPSLMIFRPEARFCKWLKNY